MIKSLTEESRKDSVMAKIPYCQNGEISLFLFANLKYFDENIILLSG